MHPGKGKASPTHCTGAIVAQSSNTPKNAAHTGVVAASLSLAQSASQDCTAPAAHPGAPTSLAHSVAQRAGTTMRALSMALASVEAPSMAPASALSASVALASAPPSKLGSGPPPRVLGLAQPRTRGNAHAKRVARGRRVRCGCREACFTGWGRTVLLQDVARGDVKTGSAPEA
jgi:hypothetical protein